MSAQPVHNPRKPVDTQVVPLPVPPADNHPPDPPPTPPPWAGDTDLRALYMRERFGPTPTRERPTPRYPRRGPP